MLRRLVSLTLQVPLTRCPDSPFPIPHSRLNA